MNVNQEIIRDTVTKLLKSNNNVSISYYINNAISNHRQVLPAIKPSIEFNNLFVFVFFAEPLNLTEIELTGFEIKNRVLLKEKKIRIYVEKNSEVIQNLLEILYTNIASNIQL